VVGCARLECRVVDVKMGIGSKMGVRNLENIQVDSKHLRTTLSLEEQKSVVFRVLGLLHNFEGQGISKVSIESLDFYFPHLNLRSVFAIYREILYVEGGHVGLVNGDYRDFLISLLSLCSEQYVKKMNSSFSHKVSSLPRRCIEIYAPCSTSLVLRGLTGLLLPNNSKRSNPTNDDISLFRLVLGFRDEYFRLEYRDKKMVVKEEGKYVPITLQFKLNWTQHSGDIIQVTPTLGSYHGFRPPPVSSKSFGKKITIFDPRDQYSTTADSSDHEEEVDTLPVVLSRLSFEHDIVDLESDEEEKKKKRFNSKSSPRKSKAFVDFAFEERIRNRYRAVTK